MIPDNKDVQVCLLEQCVGSAQKQLDHGAYDLNGNSKTKYKSVPASGIKERRISLLVHNTEDFILCEKKKDWAF